jgi:hypothetical protein
MISSLNGWITLQPGRQLQLFWLVLAQGMSDNLFEPTRNFLLCALEMLALAVAEALQIPLHTPWQ